MPFSVLPAPSQLVLKHIRPNQPCWQACGWVWSLVGLYSYFHNVFVERWHGHRWCDHHAAINLCQISSYPIYSFTMIYFNQKARLLRTILKTFLFLCMTGCMTYFSDGCIWFLLQDKNRKFSARCEMFEALPMGNSWHDAQVLDAWDYMWKHLMAKVAGLWHGCAWQSLTVNSGKHGQVDVCLMKNGALH